MSDVPDPPASAPSSWKAAAAEFVTSRVDLARLEARDAGARNAKRVALVLIIIGCAFFFWLLANATILGWICSLRPDWPWFAVAAGLAAAHLLLALACVVILRQPSPPSFPLTRAELAKDKEWLETLKNDPTPKN